MIDPAGSTNQLHISNRCPAGMKISFSRLRQTIFIKLGVSCRRISLRHHSTISFVTSTQTMAQRQKSLFLTGINGNFVLRERGIPKPGPEQLLVKIDSAALNPLDWKIRSFGLYVKDFPAVLGIDGAGTVEEAGANVSGLGKGDRV